MTPHQSWQLFYPYHAETEKGIGLRFDATTSCLTLSRQGAGHEIKGKENPPFEERNLILNLESKERLSLILVRDTASLEVFVNNRDSLSLTFYEKELGQDFLLTSQEKLVVFNLVLADLNL